MKDLGTFRKTPPIFTLTTTDAIIAALLLGFILTVSAGMMEEAYKTEAVQMQEMLIHE